MAEVIKTYPLDFPGARVVGRLYSDSDRVNGGFGAQWQDWMHNQRFGQLRAAIGPAPVGLDSEGEEYLGFMRWKEGETFQYWIGLWGRPRCAVPEGFQSVDVRPGKLGIAWLQGTDADLYGQESRCAEALVAAGLPPRTDAQGAQWFMERYIDSRFLNVDAQGRKILDIAFFV